MLQEPGPLSSHAGAAQQFPPSTCSCWFPSNSEWSACPPETPRIKSCGARLLHLLRLFSWHQEEAQDFKAPCKCNVAASRALILLLCVSRWAMACTAGKEEIRPLNTPGTAAQQEPVVNLTSWTTGAAACNTGHTPQTWSWLSIRFYMTLGAILQSKERLRNIREWDPPQRLLFTWEGEILWVKQIDRGP